MTRSVVLLVLAVVFFAVLGVAGFGWWDWAVHYELGWFGFGLACWKAAELP